MNLNIQLSEADISALVRRQLLGHSNSSVPIILPQAAGIVLPPIGTMWEEQGGVYGGITRGINGGRDYAVIAGPEEEYELDYNAAMKRAPEIVIGSCSDFDLPWRKEQALLFANVPELFKKEWYWSREQHPAFRSIAYAQVFGYGSQLNYGKDSKLRVRFVRRLPIQ